MKVTKTFKHATTYQKGYFIYTITTASGRSVKTTENHPFGLEDGSFLEVSALKIGDRLKVYKDGSIIIEEIAAIEAHACSKPIDVYNLEVEDPKS